MKLLQSAFAHAYGVENFFFNQLAYGRMAFRLLPVLLIGFRSSITENSDTKL